MILVYGIAIGLGVMKLVELEQEVLIRIGLSGQKPWFKSFLTLAASLGLSILLFSTWKERILVALGASGVAAISHAVVSLVSKRRDEIQQNVITRFTTGRSRL